ncbi:MAG: spondin domain-containing protein, partial [Acidimicrobiia bacterium]
YTFSFEAGHGDFLSFATMLVNSDDRFFGPGDEGIALFDGDAPFTGDVSDQVSLWDAGTETGSVVTQVGDGAGVVVTITAG